MYLDDEDGATRKDAALCCCKLVANSFSVMTCTQFGTSRSSRTGGKRRRLVEEVYYFVKMNFFKKFYLVVVELLLLLLFVCYIRTLSLLPLLLSVKLAM